jgi:serine/threonine protein kinase
MSLGEKEHPGVLTVELCMTRYIAKEDCLSVFVVDHNIVRTVLGSQLTENDSELLIASSKQFISAIKQHYQKVDILQNDWWNRYKMKMRVDQDNSPRIVDVQGCDADYDCLGSMAVIAGGLIAYGGQKLVLRCAHNSQGKSVDAALYKVRNPHSVSSRCDFSKEIFILKSLQELDCVVQVHHANEKDCWALVERLSGTVLQWINKASTVDKLTTKQDAIRGCAQALAAVHEKLLVHRDVKPENFLYNDQTKQIKIADFGLSVFMSNSDVNIIGDVGTLSYKAPEVFERQNSQKADVFSLGISIWEIVYERNRFRELKKTFIQNGNKFSDLASFLRDAAKNEKETTACGLEMDGKYGQDVDEVIRQCTHKDPMQRPTIVRVVEMLALTVLTTRRRLTQNAGKLRLAFQSVLSD